MIRWSPKRPAETVDYVFDLGALLAAGEAIASFTVTGTGVTVDSSNEAGEIVTVWLSGGTEGSVARVDATVTTDSVPARTFVETAVLEIGGDPLSLAEAKAYLRVEHDDEDMVIAALARAAVAHVESVTGKKLTPRIVEQKLPGFGPHPNQPSPETGIRLWHGPASEILEIAYDDPDGVAQLLADFRLVEGANARLLPAYGESWPPAAEGPGTVRLTYVAGYEVTDRARAELEQAAKMLMAHWYANREAVVVGGSTIPHELPLAVSALIALYRPVGLA